MKFKVGDRVIYTNQYNVSRRAIIASVLEGSIIGLDYAIDILGERNRNYLSESFLDIDTEYYRDQSLNTIGI